MILRHLRLMNIAQHDDLELDLEPGLTAIVGPNQAGKSNIIRAIKLAVTGQCGRNLDRILQLGTDKGSIQLDMSVGDVDCSIGRFIRSNGSGYVRLSIGGAEYGEGTDHNVSVGYDALFELIGTHPELLDEIVFAGQSGLGSFLSASPAVRKRTLQSIFGTKVAEKARGLLLDELNSITIEDHEGEKSRCRQEIIRLQEQLEKISKQLSALSEVDEERRSQLQKLVTSADISSERKEELEEKLEELEVVDLARDLQDKRSELDETEKSISDYEEYEQKLRDLMKKHEGQAEQRSKLKTLNNRESELSAQLEKVSPRPDVKASFERAEELREKEEEEKRRLLRMEQLLSALTDEDFDPLYPAPVTRGECPTCGTELGELPDGVSMESYLQLRSRHERTCAQHTNAEATRLADRDQAREHDRLEDELSQVRSQLAPLQQINFVSDEDYQNAKKTIEGLKSLRSCRVTLKSQVDMARQSYEAEKAREVELREELEGLEMPDSAAYTEAQSTLDEMSQREESRQNLEGRREQCQSSIAQSRARLEKLEEEIQADEAKRTYRAKLASAREYLHRDNLPSRAASSVVRAINDRLAKCMEQFQLDFSGWIDPDDLSPYFVSPDTPEVLPHELMSGGQEVAFAICFYVALWELYLPKCSLLTLDEPTRYQDPDRKRALVEFFDSVRGWCQQTSSQLIVPTHDGRLANSADRIIEVGK